MLPRYTAYRSSVTQTEEVLINKCLVYGKSIGTQTDYTVPYHVTIATQTLKHHIDQDIGSVFGLEMSVERTLKHKDNDGRFCGLSKNDKGSDTRVRDVIDLESDMVDDSDPPYSPDFEECFESDDLIDDESDNDKGTLRRKFSGKKTSLVQHQNSDKNESSVKDIANSELHLGKTNSTLVTSSEDLNEVNMIKVNLVQIVDKNGEKKLQMVLTKPDCHGNLDTGPVSKVMTDEMDISVNHSLLKAKSHGHGDDNQVLHVQTNQIGIVVNNSPLKLNSDGNNTTKVLQHQEENSIGIHATNSKSNDTKNTKLVSLLNTNQSGVQVSPLKSNSEGNTNTKLISLLQNNQTSLLVNDNPSKSNSNNSKTTKVLKNVSLTKSNSDGNKNVKLISLLQKGTPGSISKGQSTKYLEDINDGDNDNCVSLSESENVNETITCNPKNDTEGLKSGNSKQLTPMNCQKISTIFNLINPETNEGTDSSMWKQIMNVGSQVELQESDKTSIDSNRMEQQDESQTDILKEGQMELETSQIETQFKGQSQVHHVDLHITTNQMELFSGDQVKLQTGIQNELQSTKRLVELQEEKEICSQVENQRELQTIGHVELETEDQVAIQTGDEVGLETGHQSVLQTCIQEGSQLQLQIDHTELQKAVSQIELQTEVQNVSQTENHTELQFRDNENVLGQDYNEVTEQTNSQYMYCEEKENVISQMTCAVDQNNIIYTQDGNYILVNQNVIDGYQNYEIIDGAGMDGSVFKVLSVQEPIEIEMVNDTENEIIEYGTGSEFVHNYCKKTTTKTRQSRKKGRKNKSKCRVEGTDINAEVEVSKLNANKGQGKNKSCVRKQKELKEEKPMPSLQCEFCGECFLSEARLDRHVAQEHSDKRIWKCEFCDRVYRRRKGLKTHVQTHVKEPTHECSICAKKCLTLWQLKVHLQTHDKTKLFQCKHCDKTFKSSSAHKDHEITHELSPEVLYVIPCNSCNKKFQNQQKLKLHIQRMHSKETTKFKCDFCEKCFSMKGNLNTHLRTHTKERPFQCKFCTKSFTLKCTLLEHEKRHQGIKNFSCDECDMCFVNKSSLNAHKLSHSDVKKYKCEVCGLGLKSKVNLNMHMRIHSGEKPFSCTQCSKSFRTKFVLKKHMRSHTGEKLPPKFPCDICGKLFITSYNRKIHQMNHTGDKPFICELCGQKFSTQAFLNSHMKTCDDDNFKKTKKSARITQKTASTRKSTT